MAEVIVLPEIALKYAELSQASYNDNNIDLSSFYNIINIKNDTFEGYSATLFQEKGTNEFTYGIKGTYVTFPDISQFDINDLNLVDIDDDDVNMIFDRVPDQFEDMVNDFQSMIDKGYISQENPVTVTGHSLAGAEAQILTAVFPDYIKETYTQNAPGALNLVTPNIMEYQGEYYRDYEVLPGGIVTGERISKNLYEAYQNFGENKNSSEVTDKIYNLKAKDGMSPIADLGEDIGNNNINIYGDSHSIDSVVDTLKVYKSLYDNYLNDEGGIPTDFYSWMNNEKDKFTFLDGGYGDIAKLPLSDDNEIYLVKNENKNYDKYELTPDSYSLDGEVTEYNVKAYDSEGNLTYSYDANESYELNIIQDGENLTLTKTSITLLNDNVVKYEEVTNVPLTQNQTISHIAQQTGKSTIDLAEYNNISMEEAKSLPVGTPIRSYKGDPEIINTPDGNIKLFTNHDGTQTAMLPEGITGEKTIINFDDDISTLLYRDRTNPDKITYVDTVTNNYIEIQKDSNGSYYKSLESNDDFSITYDKNNTAIDIQIISDNVNLTSYSKELSVNNKFYKRKVA